MAAEDFQEQVLELIAFGRLFNDATIAVKFLAEGQPRSNQQALAGWQADQRLLPQLSVHTDAGVIVRTLLRSAGCQDIKFIAMRPAHEPKLDYESQ